MASRYDNLNAAIAASVDDSKKNKPYRIIEIGVHKATRAVMMVKLAKKLGRSNVEYYGFDLFEDMTESVNKNEFGKPELAMGRDEARKKIISVGAAKVQLVKGDTKLTLPQAVKEIPTANVVFIDGGHTIETIAHDLENVLNCCAGNTHILMDDCYPDDYIKGCAFILKCSSILDEYGIKVKELEPVDVIEDGKGGTFSVRVLSLRCAAQLVPEKLAGLANRLINELNPSPVEPQEFFPEKSFVESPAKSEASESAGTKFREPADSTGCADVQPVRVCENSCGDVSGNDCERSGNTCGRWQPEVERSCVEKVSEEPAPAPPVSQERQESDQVVEPGNTDGLGAPCPSDNSGELRPEVPPELEQGNNRGSRRRRRRGRPNDECSGPQS